MLSEQQAINKNRFEEIARKRMESQMRKVAPLFDRFMNPEVVIYEQFLEKPPVYVFRALFTRDGANIKRVSCVVDRDTDWPSLFAWMSEQVDSPLSLAADRDALRRSAETSQAIEEGE